MTHNPLGQRVFSSLILAPPILFVCWSGGLLFYGVCAAVTILAGLELKTLLYDGEPNPRKREILAFAAPYVLICALAFVLLREFSGSHHTLLLILSIWASDTCAYFFGSLIGGAKLAPKISPGKTWAGFWGAMVGGGVMYSLFALSGTTAAGFPGFLVGAVIGGAGQAGDLFLSWVKRQAGVKDSGDLIPGHGGILDRIDSLLLASLLYLALTFLLSFGT